jgi:hypothetical protein
MGLRLLLRVTEQEFAWRLIHNDPHRIDSYQSVVAHWRDVGHLEAKR